MADKKNLIPKNLVPKNLVIVRAGDNSLHEGWLEGQRNWDLIVSCYGNNLEKWQRHDAQRDDISHITYQGGKFDGLYDAFQQIPGLLEKYEYIMMADDDFKMTSQDINRLFEIMREYDLQIGHPSFSYQSYGNYFPAYHNPYFKIRYSNFVENGVTCLHRSVWRQILPLFEDNPMGYYIDYFWARLTDDPARQVAFIDDIQITHTQPYGSGILYKKKKEYGWKEKGPVKYIVLDHDLKLGKWRQPKIVCHAGILKNGRHVRGRWAMLPFLASGWLHTAKNIHRSQIVANRAIHRCFKQAVKNQITGTYKPTKTHIIIPDHDQKHQKPKKDKKNLVPKNLVPKNLVIVRAGDHSLHESWLDGQRNWDIVVSGFGSNPDQWKRHDAQHDDPTSIFYRGGKFDGIYDTFQQIPDLLEKYEYIMMIDDDFKTTAHDLNRLFEIMREHDLQIGYPSLSYQSHGLYFPAYHNPRFKIRFSNFVENNAVCLHQSIWRQILPLYQDNPMGHRIDDFWARLSDEPARQVAFIDDIQITHTRPHGSGELHQNKEKYNWRWEGPVQYTVPDYQRDVGKWDLIKIVCHAGILQDGSFVSSRDEMLPHLTAGWRETAKHIKRSQMRRKRSVRRCIKFSIKNQRTGTSNLAKTHIVIDSQKTAAAPDPAQPPQEP